MTTELRRRGYCLNHKRTERLMAENAIVAKDGRRRKLRSRFRFETRAQARQAITTWIKHYNATRLHSSLGNLPPIEWELRYRLEALQAA